MKEQDYTELFDIRGHQYDHAMRAYPNARDQEFLTILKKVVIEAENTVLDIPAGGGYLQRYLPENIHYISHEPCASFNQQQTDLDTSLLPLTLDRDTVDVVISLAGVHHIHEKGPLFNEIQRVLKPQGQFILADVHEESNVASFLDGFIGNFNSTGHEGVYLNDETPQQLSESGWQIESAQRCRYQWQFENDYAMANFCMSLFDLQNVSHKTIIAEIDKRLGVTNVANGIGMNWELFLIKAIN